MKTQEFEQFLKKQEEILKKEEDLTQLQVKYLNGISKLLLKL